MKVLLTGANGFLGRVLQEEWGTSFELITLGRKGNVAITCDLSKAVPVIPPVDMVVHAAGKAHTVARSADEENDFFSVNVQGTKNLLTALENNSALKKFVFISSVSVYGLTEGTNITEDYPLLAVDPYGKSKVEAEQQVSSWCADRNIEYYILRLPLIAGKHPPGNLGAMIKAIKKNRYISFGSAAAKKSVVLAKDIATLIKSIQGPSGIYNLTDGYHPSFAELERNISLYYNKKIPFSMPLIFAKWLGFAGDVIGAKSPVNSNKIKKITSTLTFNDGLARTHLKWQPSLVLQEWEIE